MSFMRAMAKDRGRRYPSGADLAAALRALGRGASRSSEARRGRPCGSIGPSAEQPAGSPSPASSADATRWKGGTPPRNGPPGHLTGAGRVRQVRGSRSRSREICWKASRRRVDRGAGALSDPISWRRGGGHAGWPKSRPSVDRNAEGRARSRVLLIVLDNATLAFGLRCARGGADRGHREAAHSRHQREGTRDPRREYLAGSCPPRTRRSRVRPAGPARDTARTSRSGSSRSGPRPWLRTFP